jgi:TonB family protein
MGTLKGLSKLFVTIAVCLLTIVGLASAQVPAAKPTPRDLVAKLGLLNGKAVKLPKPVYPPAAVKSKASGAVSVNVTVDEKGDVITATSGFENVLLRDAAITAARQAKFEPYMFQGKARKVTGTLVYNFTGPPKDDPFDMSDLGDYLGKGDGSFLSMYSIMDVPDKVEGGKYDEAIKTLDPLIAKDPKDQWALGYRATAYYGKSDMARALADANAALAVRPENTRALNVRALVERRNAQLDLANKDFDAAIAASTAAIAKRPGSMDDYFARAETYRLKGENEKAAADYRKTLELTPGYQFAQAHLDQVTGKTGELTISGETDAQLKTRFAGMIEKNNTLGAVYDRKRTAVMALEASGVRGARLCQPLAEFNTASLDFDPNLNELIEINGNKRLSSVASQKQIDGLKAALKWRAESYLPNKAIIKDLQAKNGCTAPVTGVSEEFKRFKAHFEEFNRLDRLFDNASERTDAMENAIKADNQKNGRPMFTKPADNSGICKALSEMDDLYNKSFSESYDMTAMKEADELKGYPDFIKFADQVEEAMEGRGGDILTRQMLWGCKTK